MSNSGLAFMQVFGMLGYDPKIIVVNREVLPDRPTGITPFEVRVGQDCLKVLDSALEPV